MRGRNQTNRLLLQSAMGGHLFTDNLLVDSWQGELRAQTLNREPASGGHWTIARDVLNAGWSGAQAGLSDNGTLVYLEAPRPASVELVWVDRQGKVAPIPAPARSYTLLDLPADGERLLVGLAESAMMRPIWSHTLAGGERVRLLDDAPEPPSGIWSLGGGHALANS